MNDPSRQTARLQGGSLQAHRDRRTDTPAAPDRVLAYHERTKHRLDRYAAGPETLDWSSQPDPFRCFAGAPNVPLPLTADRLTTPYSALYQPGTTPPRPLSLESIGLLFELSLGLSAWKEYGSDRWALRCNPSSGNLHPTEGYLLNLGIPGLEDGVHHYLSRDHRLERRCTIRATAAPADTARALIGLSSIHWREAWKYGERAFRYCQLDVGHALGALRYAAAAIGWQLHLLDGWSGDRIACALGLDRAQDFFGAEGEEAELLLEVGADAAVQLPMPQRKDTCFGDSTEAIWAGQANVLDPHPMYHWPVIDEVAEATRPDGRPAQPPIIAEQYPPRNGLAETAAATVIRRRRSAQRFDGRSVVPRQAFHDLLDALLPRAQAPWDVWNFAPRLHPVLFVHRVADLTPGLYALPRRQDATDKLRAAMHSSFEWIKPNDCPDHLPLFRLATGNCERAARTICCHQAIASDGAFALGMLAEFEDTLATDPWRYRQLHWEAGLLGQVLYLEAETLGLRGTGIGCYFDDAFHELLGLSGRSFQSLYHFTVGFPLTDTRILTLPPYPGRTR